MRSERLYGKVKGEKLTGQCTCKQVRAGGVEIKMLITVIHW